MQFSILLYGEEGSYDRLPEAEQLEIMAGHERLQKALGERGPFATAKLMPSTTAVTLQPAADKNSKPLVMDGPFAETKERFLGFYAAEFKDLEEALVYAAYVSAPNVRVEVRQISWGGGVLGEG